MSWAERYRPQKLAEVVGQEKVISYLQNCVNNGMEFNHMIFYGLSGTGKTTTAHALAKEMGTELLEFNASNDRSLTFIRNTIIPAMRYKSFTGKFKLIFLDETESLLKDAMFALRRPLEQYFNNCRIIFSCNDKSNIIDAIISRTIVFQFIPISKENIIKRLQYIAQQEGINIEKRNFEQISEKAKGDLRKAINWLQVYKNDGWSDSSNELESIFNRY